jgi:hypothetical protein
MLCSRQTLSNTDGNRQSRYIRAYAYSSPAAARGIFERLGGIIRGGSAETCLSPLPVAVQISFSFWRQTQNDGSGQVRKNAGNVGTPENVP